jgi:transposase InsO family protein
LWRAPQTGRLSIQAWQLLFRSHRKDLCSDRCCRAIGAAKKRISDSPPRADGRSGPARIATISNGIPEPRCIRHLVHIPALSDIPINALVDTGASDSFFDKSICSEGHYQNLKFSSLPSPIPLFLFNGSQATDLTSFIRADIHSLPTGPSLQLSLLKTDLSQDAPVVLGMDYLRAAQPRIDWDSCRLSFDSASQEGLKEVALQDSSIDDDPATTAPTASTLAVADVGLSPTDLSTGVSSPDQVDPSFFFDPEEDPDDIADILRVVPSAFHDYSDVFSKARAEKLPSHRSYDHAIDLIDETNLPPVGPIYSTSSAESQALKVEIDGLLAKGFIRPSTAPIGAPVLFVKKKDSTLRMCIDYRQLNLRTKKNKYPLPPINFLLERLAGAKVFTKIDLRGAYHLLRIAAGHEWKTTFRCRYGSFEFLVMPFGLTNAPSAFQNLINDVLREHLDDFVIAYLDDILIYSSDSKVHETHVRLVLELLRKNNLYGKASKCVFQADQVEFLGYVVGRNGIDMDKAKIQTIIDWPPPRNVKAVQSFLGFANFYRRFIRNYSKLVAPMTALTKKDIHFHWTNSCQGAFEALKEKFTTAPILRHFNPEAPTVVETDASDYAIGTIISQMGTDGLLHPVAFDSRKFQPAELNYEIHDKEMLAIVWAFKRWRSLLLSTTSPVTVLTDHLALTYFMSDKQLTRRQSRWAEMLADYNFVVSYRPGKQSEKPDALSRRDDVYPSGGDGAYAKNNPHNFTTLLKSHNVTGFRGRRIEKTDEVGEHEDFASALLRAQAGDPALQDHKAKMGYPNLRPQPTIRDDGVLLLDGKIAVPADDAIKLRILRQKHDHPTAGHPGRIKTIQLISRDYYWRASKAFVADYIATCGRCARNKPFRQKPYGQLQPLPISKRPWSSLSMDFIDQLPKSGGFDSILVVVCRFTKMSIFIPTRITATSRDLADAFLHHVFSKHGLPDDIVSDRGSKFVSKFWKALCDRLSIERKVSTAYHPETDGQTERVNQTLEQYLRIYCAYQQDDWNEWLPMAEFAYNNSDHTSTGVSPFKANYGYDPSISIERGASSADPGNHYAYRLDDLHQRVRATLANACEVQKHYADKRRQEAPPLKVGDRGDLATENLKTTRPTRKFAERYIGPFEIVNQISKVVFKLNLPETYERLHPVFHVSLLRPAPRSNIVGRSQEPPGPINLEEPDIFDVESIADSRIRRRRLEYLVQWKGYEAQPDEFTWEPAENLIGLTDEVDEFHARYPEKASPKDL